MSFLGNLKALYGILNSAYHPLLSLDILDSNTTLYPKSSSLIDIFESKYAQPEPASLAMAAEPAASYNAKQNRIETNEDFADSPAAYTLLNTELGGQYQDTLLHVSLGVNNILNTSYRDYMNRYRYYTDDLGISIFLILNYTF